MPREESVMMKLRWAILFTALTVFLTACPSPVDPVVLGVKLSVDKPSLTAAGTVTLTADITSGTATKVDFFIKGQAAAIATDDTAADGFKATPNVAATTTYVATATDAAGVTANSNEVAVTVTTTGTVAFTLTATPNPVPVGGAPVKLTTVFTLGADKVKSVDFAVKGGATLNKDTTGPDFSFTTAAITAATTFVATAKDAGGTSLATAEVAVTVGGPGSGATVNATTLAEIKGAPENANIVVKNNIACTNNGFQGGDPCIQLKQGQKLAAGAAGIKISTDLPGGPSVPGNSDDSAKVTVVKMANNTAVEGFTFDGTDIYTAIEAPKTVTDLVIVKDVTITVATSNTPVRMESVGDVTITNLTFTTTKAISIIGFKKATFTGLKLTINRPAPVAPATSAGPALAIQSGTATSELILDGLDLTTNLGGAGNDGLLIQPDDGVKSTSMKATVKNSKVTFPVADIATSIAFNFNVGTLGGKIDIQAGSTGNSTNSTDPAKVTYDRGTSGTDVTGTIGLP
jgi:hypothetical protein